MKGQNSSLTTIASSNKTNKNFWSWSIALKTGKHEVSHAKKYNKPLPFCISKTGDKTVNRQRLTQHKYGIPNLVILIHVWTRYTVII